MNSAVTSSSVACGWALTISRSTSRPDSSILGGRPFLFAMILLDCRSGNHRIIARYVYYVNTL